MKQILFIFLILPLFSFGQEISILVLDFETNEPLPFANIYFKKSGIGASTNMEGLASFEQSDLKDKDTIVVSYIGYDKQTQLYSKDNSLTKFEIKLKSSLQVLSEVVVTYVRPQKPEKIIKTAIKNTSKNYSDKPVIYKSLYRETIDENGTFIQLNEAILNTHYTAYPQKKLDRKIWENWFYDESYAFELEGIPYFYPLLKDFNTKEDQQTILASRHSDNLSKYGIETTLIGDPLLLFAFDKIKYQYDFFNPTLLNKYHFQHQPTETINGETCYVISFYPETTDRNFSIDQSRKNKSPIYIGRIYISKDSYALLRFQYKLAVDRDFGFFAKRIPLDYQVEMNYKKQGGLYHIQSIKFSETKKVGVEENGESILHKANKEVYVLDVQTENVTPYADSSLFKSTRFSSIRHFKRNYNPDYWKELVLADSLKLSPKIVTDLEINQSLPLQFKSHKEERKIDLPTPIASKSPYTFDYHNSSLVDSLHWMANPAYESDFKAYLADENIYAKNELIEDKKYQKKLFEQLNTFYKKPSDSKREIKSNTYFFEEDSLNNDILYYQEDSINRVEVFNLSLFETKHNDVFIKRFIPNKSKNLILVLYQKAGVIGDFTTILPFGENSEIDSVSNVYTVQWYSDSIILYTKTNDIGSARELCFYDMRNRMDSTIYTENNPEFDVEVTKIDEHLFCTIQSKTENEIYLIGQNSFFPEMELIKKREKGVVVEVKINDGIYLLVNDEKVGSSIEFCTYSNPNNSTLFASCHKDAYILDILPMKNKVIALVYEKSIPKLKHFEPDRNKWQELELKLGIGDYRLISTNDSTNSLLFSFSSPSQPDSKYRYNFNTSQLDVVSKTESVNPTHYKYTSTKRIWAKSHDGVKIPITIVKNRAATKSNSGLILKVYGAYGAITTPSFDPQDAILLEQGYTIAYAHVRGESILGQSWYKSGRELQKEKSILDYVACAEYLIKKDYTTSELLIGYGNSAGGLIVAQAVNLKPELFNTIVLDHPYLDVTNTMMNDTLPLTIDEYKEWGNPQNKEVYDYILKYSPYQNIKPQQYPNVLLIASYQDFQTPIWQVAKYTARLRENNLSDSEIIMLTDMSSGHIGNTTGKEWIKLFAETYSFIKEKNKKPVPNKTYKQ
ncbi:MAG: prolyl oligopeptidase family serine peptidase [Flavobacteriales bacterium]|nr:prolyl oligopeptidase family serine peptidase [Flavobacteriales bacterium]MCB9363555.1 prolyl oligopeptidase family serine peptidase [Flavobacteriales bacterium]